MNRLGSGETGISFLFDLLSSSILGVYLVGFRLFVITLTLGPLS